MPEGKFDSAPEGSRPVGGEARSGTFRPDLTTPSKAVWDNDDGTRTEIITTGPTRVQQADSSWRDVDLTIREDESADRLVPTVGLVDVSIPTSLKNGLVTVGTEEGPLSFSLAGVEADEPSVSHESEVTAAFAPGRESVLAVTKSGFKHSVVISERDSALRESSYRLDVELPAGISARQGEQFVEFVNKDGTVLGLFGAGVAYDSSASADDALPAQSPVITRLSRADHGQVEISVEVDPAWIADPRRVFPVTIDPTYMSSAFWSSDTWVLNLSSTSNWSSPELNAGNLWAGAAVARGLLRFGDVPSPNANRGVVSAERVCCRFG